MYLGAGSSTTYVLPAPPGYWVPAIICDRTQPCDWQENPSLLDKRVYVLPLGSHNMDYPFACGIGLLGGNGSLADEQTSATCAGFCPAGFVCGAEATVAPTPCPVGYFCPEGTSVARPCLPGTYSVSTSLTSASECTETNVGHYAPAGSKQQTKCSPGTVQPDAGKGSCDQCEAGSYQNGEGEQACVACEPGSYCPKGASAALPCKEGSYSNSTSLTDASECTETNVGHYASAGSKHQTKCSPGTVQPDAGKGTCDHCVEGSYQKDEGGSECTVCGAGNYSANVLTCEPCQVGEYCPEGSVMGRMCPLGSTTEGRGAESLYDCGCPAGTLNTASGDEISCEPCHDDHMLCALTGLTLATAPLPPSRWRLSVTDHHN